MEKDENNMGRFLEYLKAGVLPFLAAESILIILASLVHIYLEAVPGAQGETYLLSVIIMAAWGVIFAYWYHIEMKEEVRENIKAAFHIGTVVHFVFLGVGCQFFFSGMIKLLASQFHRLFESYGNTMGSLLNGNTFLVVLYTIIIAPIAEEFVFRGVILHKAQKNIPFWGANILQAVFFGLYHQNVIQGIYATLVGLLLGLVYRRYQTIAASILLHMIINASAFVVITLSTSYFCNIVILVAGAAFVQLALKGLALTKNEESQN